MFSDICIFASFYSWITLVDSGFYQIVPIFPIYWQSEIFKFETLFKGLYVNSLFPVSSAVVIFLAILTCHKLLYSSTIVSYNISGQLVIRWGSNLLLRLWIADSHEKLSTEGSDSSILRRDNVSMFSSGICFCTEPEFESLRYNFWCTLWCDYRDDSWFAPS